MDSNKTLVFPGWMSRVKNYDLGDGIELWQESANPPTRFKADYLIGHSLGANFVMSNWQANRNAKLILINPTIFKKPLANWFYRWLRYLFFEGLIISSKDLRANRLIYGAKVGLKMLRQDFVKIIVEIPKENLLIIRGKNDNYFCDQETAEFLKKEKIRLIEIDGCGHNWDEKMKAAVLTAIK